MSIGTPSMVALPIIVIDDDPMALRLVSSCLRHAGYECKTASNGFKGLELLRPDEPALVIVDMRMPGIDGVEVCRRIRRRIDIPFAYLVVLTANGEATVWLEALEGGADDFLIKPFDPEELITRVRAGHRVCTAHFAALERAQLQQQRDSLATAVTAMEEAVGVVAHELRHPLTSVHAMLEIMLESDDRDVAERDQLRLMQLETERMNRLVGDLLTTARCQVGCLPRSWDAFDLSELCRKTVALVEARVKTHNISITIEAPATLMMRGYCDGVEQIVLNLLSNAMIHAPEGCIAMRVREHRTSSGRVVVIEVIDRGRGMTGEELEKLRSALEEKNTIVQAAMAIKGGFGLPICAAMAAIHGGGIRIDSESDIGTAVTVHLARDLAEPVKTNLTRATAMAS